MSEPSAVDRYRAAGERANTRRSYAAAVAHYEREWGGFLPATAANIAAYLADHAPHLAASTLKARLAGLAYWHAQHGFPDPTKAPLVKQVLRGIRASHPQLPRQAAPLQLAALERCCAWLERRIADCRAAGNTRPLARLYRDRVLLLIGFWRAFRSDELCRLQVQWVQVQRGQGMDLFLPSGKTDRLNQGSHFAVPALARLCPVQAYEQWLAYAGISQGPVLRRVDRWGTVGERALNSGSISEVLRALLRDAGVDEQGISSHSLRRGFAGWAAGHGWDQKSLMSYVGWRDPASALRYLHARDRFGAAAGWDLPAVLEVESPPDSQPTASTAE